MNSLRTGGTIQIERRYRVSLGFSGARYLSLVVRIAFALLICILMYSIGIGVTNAADMPARATQSLASIRAAAEDFVRDNSRTAAAENSHLNAMAADIDARLQLDRCGGALKTFVLNGAPLGARNTIGVRCDQGATWTVYVPVNVDSEIDVLVMRNSLPREAHIAAGDIETQRRRVPGFGSAYINSLTALRDQHLKQSINAGTVLSADAVTRDLVVKRGQQVLLVFDAHGLAVQAPGLALADGGTADRIRVQNQTSLKVVEGVIESGNLVRVGM